MLAQLDLLRHWNVSTAFKYDAYHLPVQLDEPVVAYQLPALDEVLTVFAQNRADDVLVNFEGPFKGSQSIPTKTGFNRADDAFQWFFSNFFPISKTLKKAEFGRQCGDDLAGGNFLAERSSNSSCRSRRALQLMDAGGLRAGGVLAAVARSDFSGQGSELPGEEGQGDKVAYILMGLTAVFQVVPLSGADLPPKFWLTLFRKYVVCATSCPTSSRRGRVFRRCDTGSLHFSPRVFRIRYFVLFLYRGRLGGDNGGTTRGTRGSLFSISECGSTRSFAAWLCGAFFHVPGWSGQTSLMGVPAFVFRSPVLGFVVGLSGVFPLLRLVGLLAFSALAVFCGFVVSSG